MAWTLEWLFGAQGWAYAPDSHLAHETSLSVREVGRALADLEAGKAIIRDTIRRGRKAERRIYPALDVVRETPAITGQKTPAITAGRNPYRKRLALSSTVLAAKLAAEIRERAGGAA